MFGAGSPNLPLHLRNSEAYAEATAIARCARFHTKADLNPRSFDETRQAGVSQIVVAVNGRICLHPAFETGSRSVKAQGDEAEARLARLVKALVNGGGPMETIVAPHG